MRSRALRRALGDQVIADMSLTVVIRSVPDLTV